MTKHVKFSNTTEVFDIPCENAGWHIRDCVKHIPCEIKFVSSEVKKRRLDSRVRIAEELGELETELKSCLLDMNSIFCSITKLMRCKERAEEILFQMQLCTSRLMLVK
jgi:hypothetical protein